MCWISKSKLTLYNFTSELAAAAIAANDDDPVVTLHHRSCMVISIVAGKGIDMKCKGIRYFIRPQGCVVSPFILATAPRDAVSLGVVPAARHKLSPIVDDREGVVPSPLGGK